MVVVLQIVISHHSRHQAKTLFLLGNLDIRKGVYFDASNTTSRILDVLEEERPKIILLDELDKMGRAWQNQLLNFLESGRIKVAVKRNVAINDHVILTQRWKHGATRDLLTKVVSLFITSTVKDSNTRFYEMYRKICKQG